MKLTVLINPLSGSVPAEAESELVAVAEETGIELNIVMAQADKLKATLEVYAKGGEDVLAVWGGDGTIACALEAVGRDGPPILPLPGGTMNLLHRRVHGIPDGDAIDWRTCLLGALGAGRVETISAGLIDGERRFYVGALFGELAGLSRAREAIREGRPMAAAEKVGDVGAFDLATSLAFHEIQGEDIGMQGEATALAAFVPEGGGDRLEIGWIDPDNLAQLAGVGVEIALGDWRSASGVEYKRWEALRLFHAHEEMMEATLDGEPIRLRSGILVGMEAEAARVLAAPGT